VISAGSVLRRPLARLTGVVLMGLGLRIGVEHC
jgi:hypothetical protein